MVDKVPRHCDYKTGLHHQLSTIGLDRCLIFWSEKFMLTCCIWFSLTIMGRNLYFGLVFLKDIRSTRTCLVKSTLQT